MIAFEKWHGLGNDFVIIDFREPIVGFCGDVGVLMADRRRGIGCDQLILLDRCDDADIAMAIYNPDGSQSGACGNATRCVARKIMDESGQSSVRILTSGGLLKARRDGGMIIVDMGLPRLGWNEIPLSRSIDTLHLGIEKGPMIDPVAVNMGNPHAIFFVEDVNDVDLQELGPWFEHHSMFPKRANISVVQVLDRGRIRQRVFERGAGITQACGSGACAAVVAGVRRDVIDRNCHVTLDGGTLEISWQDSGTVLMTGPTTFVYSGHFNPDALAHG